MHYSGSEGMRLADMQSKAQIFLRSARANCRVQNTYALLENLWKLLWEIVMII